MNAQLTEIMRLIVNLIRTGTVTEVDRKNWLCRVTVGKFETNWINWLTLRTGGGRTWSYPSPDEQVVMLSMRGTLNPPLRCLLFIPINCRRRRIPWTGA
ncbi:phage baseplate assembly protein V [Cronobacter dublinensis]|uniref:phage baseplate assembly protein V n=1 Tax=Cronobacter dublinensis TaxID=413497 RepID=UPI003AB9B43D